MHKATSLLIPFVCGFVSLGACSDGKVDVRDGGSDASTSGLSFAPSNLGSFLSTVDFTKLADIDVTGATEQLEVDCNSQSNQGCVAGTVTQSDGSAVAVYVARSWKVEPAGVLNVTDKTPVIVVAATTIDVLGAVHASSSGLNGIAGGFDGKTAATGGGQGGGSLGSGGANSDGVGGGGASYCGSGGAGGNATTAAGAAGKTYGTASLVPLLAGSAGGGSELFGGAGGGAVELVAGTSINVAATGMIDVGAGGGYAGNGYTTGQSGSGGGSGGGLLLEAPKVTVAGTLEANGGGGGGTHSAGGDATINATAAVGGDTGTTGAGGNGSAGTATGGGAGANGDTAQVATNAAGGGGGGAGYIRINSDTGSASINGTLSPALGTACATQGTLAH